jgi:LysM repeat protein
MRPEFRDNVSASFANRVRSGVRSQKYFSFGRMHEAGLYQQVGGIRPGATLRFAIFMQGWVCFDMDKCGKNGSISDAPADMHLRVGIDPYGGANPFSPNIVWSPELYALDRWVEFSVQAVAQRDTVTVFTHSRPDWTWARQSNDVYLDDASLTVVDGRAAIASAQTVASNRPATPSVVSIILPQWRRWDKTLDDLYADYTNAVQPVPSNYGSSASQPVTASQTPTTSLPVSSGGKRTYVVVQGDTLFLIAKRFNTTPEAIMQANQIANPDLIYWGLTLVIP